MRIWTASLVFAMRFIPMTKADFTIAHIFRENPTAQKWFGALHGVNLLKRRKTIKEDKPMTPQAWILLTALILCVIGCFEQEREINRLKKAAERKIHKNGKYDYKQIR